MRNFTQLCVLMLLLSGTFSILADESRETTKKAAIGGGVGGALGAAIGAELGDRKGAIIGAAVGAAIGATIATEDSGTAHDSEKVGVKVYTEVVVIPHVQDDGHHNTRHKGHHCPPGQAKKGRC